MRQRILAVAALALSFSVAAMADTVSGTVTNGTTGKPASGVTVTLVDPMSGMAELASAKTDGQGKFAITADAPAGPRLAKAERGGVNYFKMITPGTASVDLQVYDAASKVEGITGAADVLKLQTDGKRLLGAELFAVQNQSKPPRTLTGASTFEFVLPDGAQIDNATAQGPNGQPISATTKPTGKKNHYAFDYGLKPGETRFQVSYHLPYSGKAAFAPQLTLDFQHYVLMVPSQMTFKPDDAQKFRAMNNQPGSLIEVVVQAKAGETVGFAVSGEGQFAEESAGGAMGGGAMGGGGAGASGGAAMGGGAADSRPGGGLGRPEDAPDGLVKYRWYILTALMTVLIGGGIWTRERTLQVQAAAGGVAVEEAEPEVIAAPVAQRRTTAAKAVAAPPVAVAQPVASAAPATALLAALKDEIFQLEIEKQEGKIAGEEYDKARTALEQTLQRALRRAKG